MCARATMTSTLPCLNNLRRVETAEIKPIRTAVAGLGHRSLNNVLPKLVTYAEYELAAVCDLRGDLVSRATASLRELGCTVRTYTDYTKMLNAEELDAVIVQVDPDRQIDMACQAMDAGLHTMVEVPLTYSIDDCWQLAAAVERTGKVFMLMEQLRYSGYIRGWRYLIEKGVIGTPLFAEGQYFHYVPAMHYQDDAGQFYTPEQAKTVPRAKITWRGRYPSIGYLPHELSPLLFALNDRIVRVVGMATRKQGYKHPDLEFSDLQVALMHTEKDVVMRMATDFSTPSDERNCHWHHIKGSEGALESPRTAKDTYKMWLDGWHIADAIDLPWSSKRVDAPAEAHGSGHGDLDYYVFAQFADAVLYGDPVELDVYKAIDTAAPAILAAKSIAEGNTPQDVPDFRPGPNRKAGEIPGK